jgi:cell fate (sporulation/competence/biofilm development) regulator YlbF (YheA/YmcA/DUF963 family)
MTRIVMALAMISLSLPAVADVQFVMTDMTGQQSTLVSNGSKVRIDNEQMPGYGIIDTGRGEYLMVDTKRNEAYSMKLGDDAEAAVGKPVSLSVKDKGGGQKIAGYLTRKYHFSADGEPCGTIYASRKLLQNEEVRGIFEAFRAMQQTARRMTAGFAGMLTPCQRANLQLAGQMDSVGVPLRVLGADGGTLSEVLSVDTDVRVAAARYEVPAGINRVSMDQQMQQATEAMQNMPDMSEMMKQMQQSGGEMTPEMQQQIEQMQQMLQQMQQQQQ